MPTTPSVVDDLLFHNAEFVIARKSCGVLTVPSHQGRADPRPVLGIQLQEQLGTAIFPVHRLDVEVSGLVLFALTREAHRHANHWFEHQQVQKTYRAWTQSQGFEHLPAAVNTVRSPLSLQAQAQFEWHSHIARNKRRAFMSPQGKPSITRATYLGRDAPSGYLQWNMQPLTGRPHQLRVELSHHGFPVVGDQLYGSTFTCSNHCIALVAWRLDFTKIPANQRFGLPEVMELAPACPDCTVVASRR